jgi:hypothetical protein
MYQLLTQKQQFRIGISSVLEEDLQNPSEVSILEVHSSETGDFWDEKTVSSRYEGDDDDIEILEL